MTTWQELYQLANEFKQAAMWEKFCNRDLFCVKDKGMEEPLYLCVMGNAGQHFSWRHMSGRAAIQAIWGYARQISGRRTGSDGQLH